VVQEGVAAVEQPGDAAGFDVPRHALGGVEIERPLRRAFAGKRRNGEHAGEIVDWDGAHVREIVAPEILRRTAAPKS
jgi:hypothetical protein